MIQHYVTLFHPNSIKCLHITNSCVVMSVSYLPKLCIHLYYNCGIFIWINSNINVKIHKPEGLLKCLIAYFRHNNMSYHMGAIFTKRHLPRLCQQCVHIYHPKIHLHTVNLCCVFMIIDHTLILHTKNQIWIIPTHLLWYIFLFIIRRPLNENKCMAFVCMILTLWHLQNYTQEKEFVIMETSIADFRTSF